MAAYFSGIMESSSVVQGNGVAVINGEAWINGKKIESDGTPKQVVRDADGREMCTITRYPTGAISVCRPGGYCNFPWSCSARSGSGTTAAPSSSTSSHRETIRCNGDVIRGDYKDVFGNGNKVTGDHCNVFGNGNKVIGDHCKVDGVGNCVSGDHCRATGYGNSVSGTDSSSTAGAPAAPKKRSKKKISHIADIAGQPSPKHIKVCGQVNTGGTNFQSLDFSGKSKGEERKIDSGDADVVVLTEIGADEKCPENETACCVCIENKRKLLIQECGHVCLCFGCAKKLIDRRDAPVSCPMCKAKIEKKMMRAFV